MNPDEVKVILEGALPGCQFQVEGDGSHFNIVAVGDVFDGQRAVQRQQTIYKVLNQQISSGEIHAVNMKTFTHAEWESHS